MWSSVFELKNWHYLSYLSYIKGPTIYMYVYGWAGDIGIAEAPWTKTTIGFLYILISHQWIDQLCLGKVQYKLCVTYLKIIVMLFGIVNKDRWRLVPLTIWGYLAILLAMNTTCSIILCANLYEGSRIIQHHIKKTHKCYNNRIGHCTCIYKKVDISN